MHSASALSAGTGPKALGNSSEHLSHDEKVALRKAASASFAGNFIEWFGCAARGYLAAIIVTAFFPPEDRSLAPLSAFLVFAVSALPRAIGPLSWASRKDKCGRLYACLVSASAAAGLLTAACSPRPGIPR